MKSKTIHLTGILGLVAFGAAAEMLPVPENWPKPGNVPELMKTFAGKDVKDRETWEKVRAPELKKFFLDNMYGHRPAAAEHPTVTFASDGPDVKMMDGRALRKRVRVTAKGPFGEHAFTFTAFIPTAAKGSVPAFLLICNRDPKENIDPDRVQRTEFWPAEEIVSRGFAALAFWNADVAPDYIVNGKSKRMIPEQNFHLGVYPAFERCNARDDASWATLSAWAWGASRVMDWIETEPLLDAKKVAVVGHSRGGKTSLVAGVTDTRFAMACVNDSGCGGAKLATMDLPESEHYSAFLRSRAIHWFCGNFERRFVGLDTDHPSHYDRKAGLWPLKVDQHEWAALMAPRLLAVASASEDDWAGQPGEYWTCRLASPAWELYGVKGLAEGGRVHYHLRKGIHNLTLEDWNAYMDFAAANGWVGAAAPRNPTVRHIQRTMKAMAESTAERPAHVRILFYGQSIVGQFWSNQLMAELKRRYPTVRFEAQNRAIGGYQAERLYRTAESDLYPFYPDLLFFHVYGDMKKYEEIVRKVRATTTAEIVLWSSHLSKGQNAAKMLAERDARTKTIADIAERYGTMYVDLNRKWCEMLIRNGWPETHLLADGIHMNPKTQALDIYARFLYEDMERLPDAPEEPAVNGSVELVPLSDPRVKRGADGSLTLSYSGNRVVAVSDGTGVAGATGTLTLDGRDPATFPELWYTTRPGTGPMWMPFVDHVDVDAPAVAEDWTLTFLEGTKPDANPVVYSVVGSVTGPDGTGSTKELFRSKSGRAVLNPRDINCVWQYSYSKKQAKPGFQVKWSTRRLFAVPYAPTAAGARTVLVQNCANGPHELVVTAKGGALGIGAFIVHAPRR